MPALPFTGTNDLQKSKPVRVAPLLAFFGLKSFEESLCNKPLTFIVGGFLMVF